MASPRLTFRHVNTPSKQKRESVQTPSKRAKFRQLFDEPDNAAENILSEKISAVKCTFLQGTEEQDPSILIASLVCTYGFMFAARLLGAICHVPNFFIERYQYIFKIVNCDGNHLSLTLVEKYARSLQAYAENSGYEVDRKTLWSCTNKYNEGFLMFLMPPVSECLQCSGTLYSLNKVQVTVFTLNGPIPGMKTTTRCKKGCGAIYNVDRYSCPGKGTFYYSEKQPVISSSNCVYLTRDVHELLCESGNHAFVSHHAFSEIYNSLFSNCAHTKEFRNWLVSRKDECLGDEINEDEVYQLNNDDILEKEKDEIQKRYYLTRKKAINGYLNGELSNEIQERSDNTLKIGVGESREDLMRNVDELRRQEIYEHKTCSQSCKAKGCETLRVIDSCWKVCMPHCMFAVEMEVKGMPLLNFPNVCTKEPKPNSVFCEKHHKLLEECGVPTQKQQFLKYLGCKEKPSNSEDIDKVDKKTLELARQLKLQCPEASKDDTGAAKYQGTEGMISTIDPMKWDDALTCNKDTGQKSRLRQRSRGHFISVTGGGHIQYFEPVFKSESPSQIFLIVLRVMMLELSNVPDEKLEEALEKFVLSYDNMCQLDSLRASKDPLPFPAPFDMMWMRIKKIIDRLHIRNHKNPKCHDQYNPDQIPQEHNTMIAEQTFSWFARFKKVVNSMNQAHHLFYIHRNIKRRNQYTESCRAAGVTPLLPGINVNIKNRK